MSFANIDLEAATPLNTSGPSNDLDGIIHNTSKQLQNFSSLIAQFDNKRKQLGVKRDSIELRDTLDQEASKLSDLNSSIKTLVDNISLTVNRNSGEASDKKIVVTNRQIVIKERLVNEYNELYRRYSKTVRQYQDKKKSLPLAVTEQTPLLEAKQEPVQTQQQQQQQLTDQDLIDETELQYHTLLTEERNREINQATEGILEVNAIFKNLGELVHQQGEQLDTVEDNIEQLQSNAHQASRELNKAHEYQKKKGKWSCIFLVALCIFVLVVTLAVVS